MGKMTNMSSTSPLNESNYFDNFFRNSVNFTSNGSQLLQIGESTNQG